MWESFNLVQKIYFCLACPATVLLVEQIIMLIVGLSGGTDLDGNDVDITGDGSPDVSIDSDPGLSIFTVKTLTAFFAVGGWVGFTLGEFHIAIAVGVSLAAGLVAMFGVAFLLRWLIRLQTDGNIQLKDAIGLYADVYLTIPKKGNGEGKITVLVNERLSEFSAMTEEEEPLPTGSKVKIVNIIGNTFIVEKA